MHLQRQTPTAFDILYSAARTGPFSGRQKRARFVHGMPETVAVFEPRTEQASRCLAKETRLPASFYEAMVSAPDGTRMLFSTGSGDEAGNLLERLCEAFASGDAMLSCSYDHSTELHTVRPTCEDGRLAWRYRTDTDMHQVLLEETGSMFGGNKPMVAVYLSSAKLADALAASCAEGMLDFHPPKSKDLLAFDL